LKRLGATDICEENMTDKEQMNIVIVGHVDHGKSTVIGRLLADTGTLPQGKLEFVKQMCLKNAKPFEYAFLLDALKDEQSQGITIDTARSFFKTKKRDYIIIDAPGHIEFLKNMITGAARAEAALLVIDAKEGIKENSRRHGYLLSMLGIKQVAILVNKMDLVDFSEEVFEALKKEYTTFLNKIDVRDVDFIPISAREGDNLVTLSGNMRWYSGMTVLSKLDNFVHEAPDEQKSFRFPVQDIYKFTREEDDRRIIAGTIAAGSIGIGDNVLFLPSRKNSRIKSIESFNTEKKEMASAGEAVGFTLETQLYIRSGELMVLENSSHLPKIGNRFKANIFWVGRAPMIMDKTYKLKLAATRASVRLVEVKQSLDASELTTVNTKKQVDRHDVAECVFETAKPIAFDTIEDLEATGRFVIVDNYEIAGGGIVIENIQENESILKQHIKDRENIWDKGFIDTIEREKRNKHKSKFVVFVGVENAAKQSIAKQLERELFDKDHNVYYMGLSSIDHGLDADIKSYDLNMEEKVRRLGELARILTDTGLIFITTIDNADDYDIEILKLLSEPNEISVVSVGESGLVKFKPDLEIKEVSNTEEAVKKVINLLMHKEVILEYYL